jgi:hypothetical protein
MVHRNSVVGRLLAYAAASDPQNAPIDWDFRAERDREFQWVIRAGLGPLLYRAMLDQQAQIPPAWRDTLLAADLAARVRHANLVDAAVDALRACQRAGIDCTLLKGISTSEEFYPSGHLRPMGDIDILVAPDACSELESALLAGGCRKHDDYADDQDEHHGPPLHDVARDVWIEVHRSLFPRGHELSAGNSFRENNVATNSVRFFFHGLPAQRLVPELQLAYIAASWMQDLMRWKIHPSFLASLVDAVFLLARERETLDWVKLVSFAGDDVPTASLDVLLTFLASRNLATVPRHVQRSLETRQRLVGPLQLRAIHAMLDHYLINGRRWTHALPPPVVGRYSLRRQWKKRIANRERKVP